MSASNLNTNLQGIWQPQPHTGSAAPEAALQSWLNETGLLTARLRSICAGAYRLEVQHELTRNDADGLHREVALCCGDQLCIYALTDIPQGTLRAHPWLADLGNDALGETLQSRADVSRSAFEYALLDSASLPVRAAELQTGPAWARRSDFLIASATVSVTEIFLAALADCEQQPRIAG